MAAAAFLMKVFSRFWPSESYARKKKFKCARKKSFDDDDNVR